MGGRKGAGGKRREENKKWDFQGGGNQEKVRKFLQNFGILHRNSTKLGGTP